MNVNDNEKNQTAGPTQQDGDAQKESSETKPEINAAIEPKAATTETKAEANVTIEQKSAAATESTTGSSETLAAQQQTAAEALPANIVQPADLKPGMTIRIHQKIKEGEKERIQVFQGIIIALRGKTPETKTVTVQKKSFNVLVEKIFPLASPLIAKIELVKTAKVRRAKLYFLANYVKRLKETLAAQ